MERGTPQFSPRRSGRATPMDQRGTRRGARSCGSTNTRKAARSDDLREVGGGVSVPIVCMGRHVAVTTPALVITPLLDVTSALNFEEFIFTITHPFLSSGPFPEGRATSYKDAFTLERTRSRGQVI